MTRPHAPGPVAPAPWALAGTVPERHPDDPDERSSTKAAAVLSLGITAVLLMFCGGGVVPATFALLLARPARAEIAASGGYLTGRRALRAGEVLSWIGLAVSAVVITGVVVTLLLRTVGGEPQFGEDVN